MLPRKILPSPQLQRESKYKNDRQCTHNVTFRGVRVITVAVEKQYVLSITNMCLYSYLSYPACQSRFSAPYYIAIRGLSVSTIFFFTSSHKRRDFREKTLLNIKLCFNFMDRFCLKHFSVYEDTQMKFYKVAARPTLLYGSETWITTKRDMTRLEAAEMRFLRSVKGYTRLERIRSEIIRKELKISGIQDLRTKYKQNWINHLERMDNNRLPKHAINYKPRGRRDRGGKDGSASMPEQVKRPNLRMMMMMMTTKNSARYYHKCT